MLFYLCNKNQLDALFIRILFRQSTFTCFGHICSPSSGGILYINENWYVLCFLVDCLLSMANRQSTKMRINSASSWYLLLRYIYRDARSTKHKNYAF